MLGVTTSPLFLLSLAFLAQSAQGEYHCPAGYVIDNGFCYYISTEETVTWYKARDLCQQKNATLVTIESEGEQKFLKERIRGPRRRPVWIGLHDLVEEDHFTWLDDKADTNYTNWDDGEPNNMEENCVSMSGWLSTRGRWVDQFCRKLNSYTCEKPASLRGCEVGWQAFAGKCYYFSPYNVQTTWENARHICQASGGDLVIVDSPDKNDFIKRNVTRSNYWIGMSDNAEEGKWKWLDQTTEASWMFWSYGEPDNGMNAISDCATLRHQHYRKGKWQSTPCTASAGFICEKLLTSPTTSSNSTETTCEEGWKFSSPSCYLFVKNATSWESARSQCQQQGADLVVIDSMGESNFLKSFYSVLTWIGLNDRNHVGIWTWLDQEQPASWTYWERGPMTTIDRRRDCVLVHSTKTLLGNWSNLVCNSSYGYICEMPAVSGCPVNTSWVEHNGFCYSFNADATSWTFARSRCRLMQPNADLARIETQATQNFINSHMNDWSSSESDSGGFWVGLRFQVIQKAYQWLETGSTPSWTNWGPREPKDKTDESCVSMTTSWSRRGSWRDEDCFQNSGYICKTEAYGDTTYFDFKQNNTVYKIIEEPMIQGDARQYCQKTLGINATLLKIDSESEMERVKDELYVRFSGVSNHIQQVFWVDGKPGDNVVDVPQKLPPFLRIPPPASYLPTTTPASMGKGCQHIKLEYKWENRQWSFNGVGFHPSICCELKRFICEKHLPPDQGSLDYDFLYGGSIYILVTDYTMTVDRARQTCSNRMDSTGDLMQIDTVDELEMISAELRLRHLGPDLEYWVDGDPNGNSTYNYTTNPKPDDHCSVLSHATFPDVDLRKLTMDVVPTKCAGSKRFICERRLDIPELPKFPTWEEEPSTKAPSSAGNKEPLTGDPRNTCEGPCIGLAVALPFVAIIPAAVVAIFLIYCRKYQYMGFAFNKANDEVYLTS